MKMCTFLKLSRKKNILKSKTKYKMEKKEDIENVSHKSSHLNALPFRYTSYAHSLLYIDGLQINGAISLYTRFKI